MLAAKIHRATVTEANLNYVGSITIDADLLEAGGIWPYEAVQVNNLATGVSWHTYAIPGQRGSGAVCLNGPPARWFQPGDLVIVMVWRMLTPEEMGEHRPRVVFVDAANRVQEVRILRPDLPPEEPPA